MTIKADWSKVPPKQAAGLKSLIESKTFPILLFGQSGGGKTCAAAAVAMRWTGYVSFQSAKRIVNDLAMGYRRSEILATVADCALLVLDEVGTRALSDAGREALLDILNLRNGKPLIITCNHGPDELAEKIGDERIASRMLAGGAIEFPQVDMRLKTTKVFKA